MNHPPVRTATARKRSLIRMPGHVMPAARIVVGAGRSSTSQPRLPGPPEYIKQMEKMGLPIKYLGPEEFGKLNKREYEEYTEVVKELGIKK
jgi:hypothetical protein